MFVLKKIMWCFYYKNDNMKHDNETIEQIDSDSEILEQLYESNCLDV